MSKRVILAGGSGFIGSAVRAELLSAGYEVQVLGRGEADLKWDGQTVGPWAEALVGAFGVVNLAGSPIQNHWSTSEKNKILDSRVQSTVALGQAISASTEKPKVWVNASAIGIYGEHGHEALTEGTQIEPRSSDFLVEVGSAWEATFAQYSGTVERSAVMRIGLVLGKEGGMYAPLRTLTRFGLGGKAGAGHQYFSWIHVRDLARAFRHVLEVGNGIYNGTAPNPVTNGEFMAGLRKRHGVPFGIPAPAFGLKLIGKLGGPDASLMLTSQKVLPERLLQQGFKFEFPELADALADLRN